MPDKRLPAEAAALWARVAATVTPLGGAVARAAPEMVPLTPPVLPPRPLAPPSDPPRRVPRPSATPSDTLDGGWDRRLRRGTVAPERAIDLHGHTLATAWAALERAIAEAVADEVRVLLVVTGKPPRAGEARRGLIRASIFDWLAQSRHATRIAAVRNAHPRHGGAGALYLILRRRRGE